MVKFSIAQYVKNAWYNIISVLIIALVLIISTIYISNIKEQTKFYRIVSPYLSENSLIMSMQMDFDEDELIKLEKSLKCTTLSLYVHSSEPVQTVVYNEKIMSELTPRLSRGEQIGQGAKYDDAIEVLISENSLGYDVGDYFTLYLYDYENKQEIPVKAVVKGVLSEGQRIFAESGHAYAGMTYEDMYALNYHKQTGDNIVITTEDELAKLSFELGYEHQVCIYKFADDITPEELNANIITISEYEKQFRGATSAMIYSVKDLARGMNEAYKNVMITYIPLTIGIFVLMATCIVGIIVIKTARNMKYYSILYMLGMKYKNAVIMTGIEMTINCFIASVLAISLITIQEKYSLIGTINCYFQSEQMSVVLIMSAALIVLSMLMTRIVLKERTPMAILRDTAY